MHVRVGLKYVRGLREEVGLKIVEERSRSGGVAADYFEDSTEKHSFSAHRAAQPEAKPYTSIDDLIRRVPEINKREIRALSLAGALNFDGTVHRRQALWEAELAIQPTGTLFDIQEGGEAEKHSFSAHRAAQPEEDFGFGNSDLGFSGDESGDTTQFPESNETKSQIPIPNSQIDTGFLTRMEGLELVDADLRKTGISIGKHPMAFIREDMTKLGMLSAHQSKYLR